MIVPRIGTSLREPILVVGGYGYRNLGDEAMLAGLLEAIGRDRRVSVVSRDPAATSVLHRVRAVPIQRATFELARHRSVLIGGGGLFGRDMGAFGRLLPFFGLFASFLGRQVAIHGIGVDEEMSPPARRALHWLASRAAELSVRDEASRDRLGVDPERISVRPDLSAWIEPADREAAEGLLRDEGLDLNRPIIGLALTGLNEGLREPVLEAAASMIRGMPRTQFCFVAMSRHPSVPTHDDLGFGIELQQRAPRLAVLGADMTPSMAIAVFGRLSAAVCMRYHSLLFAARAGVPIAAIPYAPKCDAWLREAGLEPVTPTGAALEAHLRKLLRQRKAA